MSATRDRLRRDPGLPDVDRVLWTGRRAMVGSFRLPVGHPSFADTGAIENDLVVFPRSSVRIRHEGSAPFVTDPGLATIYNRGQRYRREPISPDGDRCDWFAVDRPLARSIATEIGTSVASDTDAPFRLPHAPVPSSLYLRQRLLVRRLRTDPSALADDLDLEEEVISIVAAVLTAGAVATTRRPHPPSTASPHLADRARELLAATWWEPLTLTDLATRLGVSPFHLCRTFRRATGETLHAHRTRLRLRAALDRLQEGEADLATLALDLGFSSHSHFTTTFRTAFGHPPSTVRVHLTVGFNSHLEPHSLTLEPPTF